MSTAMLRLLVSTPGPQLELGPLLALRFVASDGWRGILPGHEPGCALLMRAPVRCIAPGPSLRWLATEGGVLLIDRFVLRISTRWAVAADTLAQLRELVEARDLERARHEHEARTLGRRHELATRRALMNLQRKVQGS